MDTELSKLNAARLHAGNAALALIGTTTAPTARELTRRLIIALDEAMSDEQFASDQTTAPSSYEETFGYSYDQGMPQ